jgi:hypothetical protein
MEDKTIEAKLDDVLAELRSLRASVEKLLAQPERKVAERGDDLVDARYVAARFGCSVRGVQSGAFGTKALTRVSKRPLRFRRGDVEKLLRDKAAAQLPAKQRALRLLDRSRGKKRKV